MIKGRLWALIKYHDSTKKNLLYNKRQALKLLDLLEIKENDNVLDVGCGPDLLTKFTDLIALDMYDKSTKTIDDMEKFLWEIYEIIHPRF